MLVIGSDNRGMQDTSPPLDVESLDLEGQGVARRPDGKVVFIEGALPFERVTVQVHREVRKRCARGGCVGRKLVVLKATDSRKVFG